MKTMWIVLVGILMLAGFSLSAVPVAPSSLNYEVIGFDPASRCMIYKVYFLDNAMNESGFEVVVQSAISEPRFVNIPANTRHDLIADNNRRVGVMLAGQPGERVSVVARAINNDGYSQLSNTREILLPLTPITGLRKVGDLWEWDAYPGAQYYFIRDLYDHRIIARINWTNFEGVQDIAVVAVTGENTSLEAPYQTMITPVEKVLDLLPENFNLLQNYPNPFNPTTNIRFQLKRPSNVFLAVYNMRGEQVAVLVEGFKSAGSYAIKFDGRDLPSGVYIVVLRAGSFSKAMKMILKK